jgi:hypothetical protein
VSSPLSLSILSATMIEFQETDGAWTYAPQLQVTETSGRTAITVTSVQFSVPGLGRIPGCLATKRVGPGGTLDVFGVDGYGDYEISFGQGTVRAAAGNAIIVVNAIDDAGHAGIITWQGPVTAGHAPPADAPRTIKDACSLG